MSKTLLETVQPTMSGVDTSTDLAARATTLANRTGFNGTLQRLFRVRAQDQLRAALIAAQIPEVTAQSVETYRAFVSSSHRETSTIVSKDSKFIKDGYERSVESLHRGETLQTLEVEALFVAGVGAVILGVCAAFSIPKILGFTIFYSVASAVVFALLLGAAYLFLNRHLASVVVAELDDAKTEMLGAVASVLERKWEQCPLESYDGEIPTFVLERIAALRTQLPQASITVHFTADSSAEVEIDRNFWSLPEHRTGSYTNTQNPLLEVSLNGESVYIPSWVESDCVYSNALV